MKTSGLLLSITLLFLASACGSKKEISSSGTIPVKESNFSLRQWPDKALPAATAFRMNGDYASNVAVSLSPDGVLAYYPAPSDLTDASEPLSLANGWYLNRQGFPQKAVFTSYTFKEYRALPSPPSPRQIMESIIPGAKVTEMIELPVPLSEALSNPEICLQYLPE